MRELGPEGPKLIRPSPQPRTAAPHTTLQPLQPYTPCCDPSRVTDIPCSMRVACVVFAALGGQNLNMCNLCSFLELEYFTCI